MATLDILSGNHTCLWFYYMILTRTDLDIYYCIQIHVKNISFITYLNFSWHIGLYTVYIIWYGLRVSNNAICQ